VRERWLRSRGAATGVALLVVLALLDYVVPHGGWYADHPMSAAALSGLLGFMAAGLFLEGWLKEREGRRLDRISTVAYRSLAQYANDAGRSLLAPLNGADLHALAIPGAEPQDAPQAQALLARHGHRPCFDEATGSWRTDPSELDPVLADLLGEPEFVRRMFRVTATVRRRLQEATALWAPVMLTSKRCSDDLGRLRDLTDALELLQEHWRRSGLIGADPVPWVPPDGWAAGVRDQYWLTFAVYVQIRDEFADLARLPSDALVRRREPRPAPVPGVTVPRPRRPAQPVH
jgi:hypothetical protein